MAIDKTSKLIWAGLARAKTFGCSMVLALEKEGKQCEIFLKRDQVVIDVNQGVHRGYDRVKRLPKRLIFPSACRHANELRSLKDRSTRKIR